MTEEKITYERVSDHSVKIKYSSPTKSTEVVARVVQPGSYQVCKPISSSAQEGGSSCAGRQIQEKK